MTRLSFRLSVFAAIVLPLLSGCGPGSSVHTPAEKVDEGWDLYRSGEFDMAVSRFQSVEKSEPKGSENYLQAVYGEASCWNYRRDKRDVSTALPLYKSIIDQAPTHPLASWSALDIVDAEHYGSADDPAPVGKLVKDYADVYAKYADTPAGEEAFLHSVSLALYPANAADSLKIAGEIDAYVQKNPKSPYLPTFYSLMARGYQQGHDPQKQLEYLIKAADVSGNDPFSALVDLSSAYWQIAYTAEYDVGAFALARDYYKRLVTQYPTDLRVLAARNALAEMDQVEADLRQGKPLPRKLMLEGTP